MKTINFKKEWILLALLLIPVAYVVYVFKSLPPQVPIHFNAAGEVNGWGDKYMEFLLPVINVGLYVLLLFLPRIDPKKMDAEFFNTTFYKIRLLIVLFLSVLSVIIVRAAFINTDVRTPYMPFLLFLFFALLGNFMINIKPNWFVGIRTPWTLSSNKVWHKTHQLFGRLWFYMGLGLAIISLFVSNKISWLLLVVFVFASALASVIYSWRLYSTENQESGTG